MKAMLNMLSKLSSAGTVYGYFTQCSPYSCISFLGGWGGGGLSPLLDFQPIPPIYQLNYILAIGYRLPALSALQTPWMSGFPQRQVFQDELFEDKRRF